MKSQKEAVDKALLFLNERLPTESEIGLILGTGLGDLAQRIDIQERIPYSEIPCFPVSTVESHSGVLLSGTLGGKRVLALQGRFHLYEGYSANEVTFPIRVLAGLGVQTLLISNAAGGLDPSYKAGDLMMLTDHINLQGENPLEGPNVDTWGPRFPDMSAPYDDAMAAMVDEIAIEHGLSIHRGIYVAVMGPNLETRAEYKLLRSIGADAVGMSTVPEVIVARHMGLRVAAFSVITDECIPELLKPVSLDDILAAARRAAPSLSLVFEGIVSRL